MSQNAKDAFNPDAQSIEYVIGTHHMMLRPLKVKAFKKLIGIIDSMSSGLKNAGEGGSASGVIDVLFTQFLDVLNLAFPDCTGFLTQEFIDDHMTVVMAKKMMEDMAKMNGLEQWFKDLAKPASATPGA